MNNLLNEYFRFNFELNIELNHFLAQFNVKMNNQNVSATPTLKGWRGTPPSGLLFQLSSMFAMFSDAFPCMIAHIMHFTKTSLW